MLRGYWVWCGDPCAKPCVSNQKNVDTCRVANFRQVYCTHSSCPFVLVNMAEEEVARFVVGNESGMCKAALAGDAPRGRSVTSSGAGSFNRFNTGKLTRSRHSKDCQNHSIFLILCVVVDGRSELE